MPLPQKRWFRMADVAKRWSMALSDLEDYALDEMLQLSVFVVDLPSEFGSWEGCGPGHLPLLQDEPILNGPQPLLRTSLLAIFREGGAEVSAFRTQHPNTYLHLRSDLTSLVVRRDDLIVTREERDRFEREHGTLTPDAQIPPDVCYNEDFSQVQVAGEWHSFGPKQAAVLRMLKQASSADDPWRDGKTLLGDVGSTTLRLADLFKRRTVWRHLIQSDGKGRYRFAVTALPADQRRIRLFRRTNVAFCKAPIARTGIASGAR